MPVQLTVKAPKAKLVRQGLQNLTAAIPKIGRQTIYDALKRADTILRQPGRAIHYPVHWDSEKQRRYVIAMLRESGNLPYRRQGIERGWAFKRSGAIGWQFYNPSPSAVYVYGDFSGKRQSRIHSGRWPLFQSTIENAIAILPQKIEKELTYYGRKIGL